MHRQNAMLVPNESTFHNLSFLSLPQIKDSSPLHKHRYNLIAMCKADTVKENKPALEKAAAASTQGAKAAVTEVKTDVKPAKTSQPAATEAKTDAKATAPQQQAVSDAKATVVTVAHEVAAAATSAPKKEAEKEVVAPVAAAVPTATATTFDASKYLSESATIQYMQVAFNCSQREAIESIHAARKKSSDKNGSDDALIPAATKYLLSLESASPTRPLPPTPELKSPWTIAASAEGVVCTSEFHKVVLVAGSKGEWTLDGVAQSGEVSVPMDISTRKLVENLPLVAGAWVVVREGLSILALHTASGVAVELGQTIVRTSRKL